MQLPSKLAHVNTKTETNLHTLTQCMKITTAHQHNPSTEIYHESLGLNMPGLAPVKFI